MNTIRLGIIVFLLLSAMTAPAAAAVYFTTSAPGIITKGDPFTVSGTEAVNGTIGIWIVGRDHFEVITTLPDRHGNFSHTFRPSATEQFSSGRYAIIVQDPGKSGFLEIEGGTDFDDNLVVMNEGKIVARLGHRQDLGENIRPAADQILGVSTLADVDDIFQVKYFFVEEPAIFFTRLIPASGFRLPDKITGERIVIPGTTNIGTGSFLNTEIHARNTNEVVTTKTISIAAGSPMNTWTWVLDTPGLPPGDYEITVSWPKSNTTAAAVFLVNNPVPPTRVPGGNPPPVAVPVQENDLAFPIFVAATLIVLAIVLYYAGRG